MTNGRHDALPTRSVIWGLSAVDGIGGELERLGVSRAVLLTTRSLEVEQTLVARVESALRGRLAGRFGALPAHVPSDVVNAAVAFVRQHDADGLVCFGGGSVIDAGKAIATVIAKDGSPFLKQIALSTTLSGSEFSHYFGVTGTDNSGATFKQSHVEAHATPAVVILDPELTLATPPRLWASSGIKAIDHAIEGLLCPGFRPTTDAVALTGIRAMAAALPSANVREALHERLMCQVAAWQCYFAPATIRFGLSHRIGHVLGGTYGVPHSVTSCITLAPVMRAFAELESSKLTVIAAALSPGQHLAVNPTTAADRLHDLVVQLDLPVRLRDVGIDRKDLSAIASLVARHYPGEVERLYPDARTGLGGLLEKMF